MVRIAFPRATTPDDLQAICKRTMIVLFTCQHIYIREPSPSTEVRVKVVEYWPSHVRSDGLTQEGIDKLKILRVGDPTPTPSYHMDMAWQREFMRRCVHGEPIVLSYYIQRIHDDNVVLQDIEPSDESPVFDNIVEEAEMQDECCLCNSQRVQSCGMDCLLFAFSIF